MVIVHYGCASIAYLKPKSENSKDEDQLISVTYTVVTPLLNPVVYTLRNKEAEEVKNHLLEAYPSSIFALALYMMYETLPII